MLSPHKHLAFAQSIAMRYLDIEPGTAPSVQMVFLHPSASPPDWQTHYATTILDIQNITRYLTENHILNLSLGLHFTGGMLEKSIRENVRTQLQQIYMLEKQVAVLKKENTILLDRSVFGKRQLVRYPPHREPSSHNKQQQQIINQQAIAAIYHAYNRYSAAYHTHSSSQVSDHTQINVTGFDPSTQMAAGQPALGFDPTRMLHLVQATAEQTLQRSNDGIYRASESNIASRQAKLQAAASSVQTEAQMHRTIPQPVTGARLSHYQLPGPLLNVSNTVQTAISNRQLSYLQASAVQGMATNTYIIVNGFRGLEGIDSASQPQASPVSFWQYLRLTHPTGEAQSPPLVRTDSPTPEAWPDTEHTAIHSGAEHWPVRQSPQGMPQYHQPYFPFPMAHRESGDHGPQPAAIPEPAENPVEQRTQPPFPSGYTPADVLHIATGQSPENTISAARQGPAFVDFNGLDAGRPAEHTPLPPALIMYREDNVAPLQQELWEALVAKQAETLFRMIPIGTANRQNPMDPQLIDLGNTIHKRHEEPQAPLSALPASHFAQGAMIFRREDVSENQITVDAGVLFQSAYTRDTGLPPPAPAISADRLSHTFSPSQLQDDVRLIYRRQPATAQRSESRDEDSSIEFIKKTTIQTVREQQVQTGATSINVSNTDGQGSPELEAALVQMDSPEAVNRMADRVYRVLERRLRTERMRKGLL